MFCTLNCANVRKWKTFGFSIDFFEKMYYNISERGTNVLFCSALMQYGTKKSTKIKEGSKCFGTHRKNYAANKTCARWHTSGRKGNRGAVAYALSPFGRDVSLSGDAFMQYAENLKRRLADGEEGKQNDRSSHNSRL